MAKKEKLPSTPALRFLRDSGVDFTIHRYDYVERGGTKASSAALGVDEHSVVKTLIFEDERKKPLVVLMHGDAQVSGKELARIMGVKRVAPCDAKTADRHSGYRVGGTSPFGTRTPMPIFMEASICELDAMYINGGARGLLVRLAPADVMRLLTPQLVSVATSG